MNSLSAKIFCAAVTFFAMHVAGAAAHPVEGFVLKAGEGEVWENGLVGKISPQNGSEGPILVEQTFPKGNSTILHVHDQGGELFYVVSGRGTARMGATTKEIGPGDVVFVPRGTVHRIMNFDNEAPLVVVFFMASPELVDQFRAIHERQLAQPGVPISPEEMAAIEEKFGGGRTVVEK